MAKLALESTSPNHHQSLPIAHTQRGEAQTLLVERQVERLPLNLAVLLNPCLTLGLCLEAKSPREVLWYTVLHRPLGSELISAPLKRYIPLCHSSAVPTYSAGLTHPWWKDRWGNVKPHCRNPREERERIILLSLPSELWTLILLLPFLVCSFLMHRNEQRHMNSLLGVDFEQPLGQEAPTSRLTDWMMVCLQFGPEYVGEFQLLTCL